MRIAACLNSVIWSQILVHRLLLGLMLLCVYFHWNLNWARCFIHYDNRIPILSSFYREREKTISMHKRSLVRITKSTRLIPLIEKLFSNSAPVETGFPIQFIFKKFGFPSSSCHPHSILGCGQCKTVSLRPKLPLKPFIISILLQILCISH